MFLLAFLSERDVQQIRDFFCKMATKDEVVVDIKSWVEQCMTTELPKNVRDFEWISNSWKVGLYSDILDVLEGCQLGGRLRFTDSPKERLRHFLEIYSDLEESRQKDFLASFDRVLWERAREINTGWNLLVRFDSRSVTLHLCFIRRLITPHSLP